jgi:hypothetical protein
VLASLWTTQDLAEMFSVTPMTIHLWRENLGLPDLPIPGMARDAVRFIPDEVVQWAKANNKRLVRQRLGSSVRALTKRARLVSQVAA